MRAAVMMLAMLAATPAAAEVLDARPDGFEVSATAHVAAPPAKLYQALLEIGRWWDKAHTWSGSAANLKLEGRAGGCLCEALPNGGSVLHMTVVYADPGKQLRLRGALGPLQGLGVEGALTWSIKPAKDGGSDMVQSYAVGGYVKGGADALAQPVDAVLSGQLVRLKAFAETGRTPG